MDVDTFKEVSGFDSCIPINESLDLNICIEFIGNQYGFTLNYTPVKDDPAGIYWKMDVETFKKL